MKNLTLAFAAKVTGGPGGGGGAAARPRTAPQTYTGGEGDGSVTVGGATQIKGAVLSVNGILYVTVARQRLGARRARRPARSGTTSGRRRAARTSATAASAMWGNYLYFVTPDDYFVSLDARTGKERWHKEAAPFSQQYFLTSAPMIVGNHIIVGTGNDLDSPGYLQSFDPETGAQQWRFYTVPMNPGDPGLETWKSLDAARHGGGHRGCRASTIRRSHLYIFGTGNPTPAYMSQPRGEGDNLFTCAIVAVNVDTGKMEWYYQTSPHDTHDWDSAQTPVLVDGDFRGSGPRKMVLTASRNGYYFTLDRATGEHMVTQHVLRHGELGEAGAEREGAAGARSGEGPPHRRRARLVGQRRRDQLAAAGATAPTPACSTCRPRRPTRCTT